MAKLVVKRYATALFDLAQSDNTLQKYQEEVSFVRDVFKNEPDFMTYLEDHKVTLEDKVELVQKAFDKKVSDPIVGLLVLMLQKGRQSDIEEVLEAFLDYALEASGVMKATVTSATKLSEMQLMTLKEKLEAATQKQIELNVIVEPAILAGLIVRVGDKVVDASYRGEIETMKKELSKIKLA